MSNTKRQATVADPFARPGQATTRGTAIEDLPRVAAALEEPADAKKGTGIKSSTRGTTLYLLPEESKRLRRVALDLDTTLHELAMRGLDRILAEVGQPPVRRYQSKVV